MEKKPSHKTSQSHKSHNNFIGIAASGSGVPLAKMEAHNAVVAQVSQKSEHHQPSAGTVSTTIVINNNHTVRISAQRNKNEEAVNDLRQRIPEIENIFDVHGRIGNGTFSTVLLGTLKKEKELPENMRRKFAIKHHIPTSHPDRIMKELQCMAKIGGVSNVVGINCCIRYNESVAFIMPYMPHDRFHDFFNKMELAEVQHYMKNLLIALRHVHKFNVIHRDVKPSNFLYNRRKRQFLLVDFGLAQQVPTSQTNANMALSTTQQLAAGNVEGKRLRDQEESAMTSGGSKPALDTLANLGSDVGGAAKRLRCTGPPEHSEQPVVNKISVAQQAPNARLTNSCIMGDIGGGSSTFKMPLKQLNEITTPAKMIAVNAASSAATADGSNGNSVVYETPNSKLVKSTSLGMANALSGNSSSRLQQKLRSQFGQSPSGGVGGIGRASTIHSHNNNNNHMNTLVTASITQVPGSSGSIAAINANASTTAAVHDNTNAAAKYNTNRNLNSNSTAAAKCYCYGNPQVCNICLIKKEIHASRAGTPGYRPPEVLLKYPDQTTSVDIWAAGVIFLSILSSVYPFFKAPNDFVALAEMVTIFGDKAIRKTAFVLDRFVTLSQKTKPLDLRKLCVRFRNRTKFSSPELLRKYQSVDGSCEVCKNCDQFYFNCLCTETTYNTEPLDNDDLFPVSAYDLLYKLLEVNPHKRITADEALKHPFFGETIASHTAASSTSSAIDGALNKKSPS